MLKCNFVLSLSLLGFFVASFQFINQVKFLSVGSKTTGVICKRVFTSRGVITSGNDSSDGQDDSDIRIREILEGLPLEKEEVSETIRKEMTSRKSQRRADKEYEAYWRRVQSGGAATTSLKKISARKQAIYNDYYSLGKNDTVATKMNRGNQETVPSRELSREDTWDPVEKPLSASDFTGIAFFFGSLLSVTLLAKVILSVNF